jgi:hypothetical protein
MKFLASIFFSEAAFARVYRWLFQIDILLLDHMVCWTFNTCRVGSATFHHWSADVQYFIIKLMKISD